MSESAVMEAPSVETPVASPAQAREPAIRPRKPRRFAANLRYNGLRYVTLIASLGMAWGLVRVVMWRGAGTPESTFLLVLAGGLLAAAAKTGIDLLNWAEQNRQAVHVERVSAIQRIFDRALAIRAQAIIDWRRIHTVLMDNLSGQPQELRFFHDHDATDRLGEKLLRKAQAEELWIRDEGVDAVRRFKKRIGTLDYNALATETEFLVAFNTHLDGLRHELAVAAIGISLHEA